MKQLLKELEKAEKEIEKQRKKIIGNKINFEFKDLIEYHETRVIQNEILKFRLLISTYFNNENIN